MALRVLLAEDSPIVQRAIRGLLQAAGLSTVIEASNGAEAVRLAREERPDVIVLDYSMPGMNGIEAACAIRGATPDARIILLTTAATEYDIAAAMTAGVRGLVLKSDAADDLVRAIYRVSDGATFLSPTATGAVFEPYPGDRRRAR